MVSPPRLLLDEPTNHLDADSIVWLRDFLRQHNGGLVVISHDVGLLDAVVNKVWYLDSNRAVLDTYNVGWRDVLAASARPTSGAGTGNGPTLNARSRRCAARQTRCGPRRQRPAPRTRCNAGRTQLAAGLAEVRAPEKVARLRFPAPAACGRTPLTAEALSKSYGSLEVFTDVDLAVDRGARVVVLGLNGAGKTTLLRLLAGLEPPDTGEVRHGHGLRLGYYAQEHETLDHDRTVLENMRTAAMTVGRADLSDTDLRKILGAFLFTGEDVDKPAGVLSGGEKTRLALAMLVTSAANVLLLDEPTNNLDPVSREQVLDALRTYAGAIVLVTHDEGAVEALQPEKVILLPDGVEDSWSAELVGPDRRSPEAASLSAGRQRMIRTKIRTTAGRYCRESQPRCRYSRRRSLRPATGATQSCRAQARTPRAPSHERRESMAVLKKGARITGTTAPNWRAN